MQNQQFLDLLALYMCSDPWPLEDDESHGRIGDMLDEEAETRGHENWIAAYLASPTPSRITYRKEPQPVGWVQSVDGVDQPQWPKSTTWPLGPARPPTPKPDSVDAIGL